MSNNPYFLPQVDVTNYAIQLLSDTIGFDEIPINVFDIPEYLDEKGVTLEFSSEEFIDNNEYGLTKLSKNGKKNIYLNSDFYGKSFDEVSLYDSKRRHCRFTLAHELGHCTIPNHIDYGLQKDLLDESNVHSRKYSYTKEYEASVFAAELLIPSITIKNIYAFGQNFKEIIENISKKYDTSFLAATLKAASLMKDSICICLQINPVTKKIVNLKYSDPFRDYRKGLYLDRNSIIYNGSIAYTLIKGDSRYEYQKYDDPSDWFPNFRGDSEAKLHEWSFRIGDNIITFLELIDISEFKLYR